jgi:hypothetical protein
MSVILKLFIVLVLVLYDSMILLFPKHCVPIIIIIILNIFLFSFENIYIYIYFYLNSKIRSICFYCSSFSFKFLFIGHK